MPRNLHSYVPIATKTIELTVTKVAEAMVPPELVVRAFDVTVPMSPGMVVPPILTELVVTVRVCVPMDLARIAPPPFSVPLRCKCAK